MHYARQAAGCEQGWREGRGAIGFDFVAVIRFPVHLHSVIQPGEDLVRPAVPAYHGVLISAFSPVRRMARIALWRFHRRAGMDAAGHQLTFLMYTQQPVADAVQSQIEENALVASLQRAGYLKGVVTTCRGREPSPAVAAHSDPGWHPHIQKTWPYYIMGVSASWLALVDGVSIEIGDTSEPKSVTELLEHYQAVHKEVSENWRGQGQHAYIHHLSAVFAYEPLFIQRFIGF